MLEHRQNSTMVCRGVLVIFRIVEVFHVIPPMCEPGCYGRRFVRILLDEMKGFIS